MVPVAAEAGHPAREMHYSGTVLEHGIGIGFLANIEPVMLNCFLWVGPDVTLTCQAAGASMTLSASVVRLHAFHLICQALYKLMEGVCSADIT